MRSLSFGYGSECTETGHPTGTGGLLAEVRVFRVVCRENPRHLSSHRGGPRIRDLESVELDVIPDSFVLIAIVLAVPAVGLIAALVASRIPSRRADS